MIKRKCSFLPYENDNQRGIFVVLYEVPIEYFEDLQEPRNNDNYAVELIHNDFMNVINNNYSLDTQIGISGTYVLINNLGNQRTFYGAFSFSEPNIRMLRDFVLYNFTRDEIATAVYESLTVENIYDKLLQSFSNSLWVFSHLVDVTISFQCLMHSKKKKINRKIIDDCSNKQVVTILK